MSLLLLILIFAALGGVLSVLAAALLLKLPTAQRAQWLPHGVSFATGALLSVAFGGLLPHAATELGIEHFQWLSATVLLGILLFFVLEKMLLWRHCHAAHCAAHSGEEDVAHHRVGTLILIGDGIHNFVDGVLIAAAFLTDVRLGMVTSLAVAAHEIPQEAGDFAILLQSGYSPRTALIYNLIASCTTVVGALLAYFGFSTVHSILPYVLSLAASSFIYIAVADLIPALHERIDLKASLEQIALIVTGGVVIWMLEAWVDGFIAR